MAFHHVLVQSLRDFLALGAIFLNARPDFSKVKHFPMSTYGGDPLSQWVLYLLQAALLAYVLLPPNSLSLWKIVAGKELALLHCWHILVHFVSQPQHYTPREL